MTAYNKKFTDRVITIEKPRGNGYDNPLGEHNSLPESDNMTIGTAQSNIFNHGYKYWLASPVAGCCVGMVVPDDTDGDYTCVLSGYGCTEGTCPLVCLSSGVTLTQSEDGNTFTIN